MGLGRLSKCFSHGVLCRLSLIAVENHRSRSIRTGWILVTTTEFSRTEIAVCRATLVIVICGIQFVCNFYRGCNDANEWGRCVYGMYKWKLNLLLYAKGIVRLKIGMRDASGDEYPLNRMYEVRNLMGKFLSNYIPFPLNLTLSCRWNKRNSSHAKHNLQIKCIPSNSPSQFENL